VLFAGTGSRCEEPKAIVGGKMHLHSLINNLLADRHMKLILSHPTPSWRLAVSASQ